MRFNLCVAGLGLAIVLAVGGCAMRRCLEGCSAMTSAQLVRRDGEVLTKLVQHRRVAAEALQRMGEQSSESSALHTSVQAWEMAMSLMVQLQNLTRREENAERLAAQRDLTSRIRCLAADWSGREGHIISAGEGMRMLGYQRELEEAFGERGRPTDSQLSAIAEGREIYMGPVEEDIGVPEVAEGTGPRAAQPDGGPEAGATPAEGGTPAAGEGDAGTEDGGQSAVDDLLGE
jgi:hypothetical protein